MKPLVKVDWLRVALGITAALICMGYVVATGSVSTNLILNPSVEIGETGAIKPNYWFPSENGTLWSTDHARTGSRSLRINVNNASAEWKSKATIIHAGYTYQIRGFVRGEVAAAQFSLTVRWFYDTEGFDLISENKISIPIGNYSQWLPLGNAFTAPNGAKSCTIAFEAVNGSGDIYGDNFEVRQTESLTKFFNSMSIALVVYIISYYIIKRKFILTVEKPQKLATTGIGIYFISWLVFWILLYTIIAVA